MNERGHAAVPTEEEWVCALKRREAWAWERLHQDTLDRVFGYVVRRVARREDAEDLTAEVFAAAVASIEHFRGDAGVFTWLIAIARRKLVDATRARRRRPEILETELTVLVDEAAPQDGGEQSMLGNPAAALERRETLARIRSLVLQLPDAQREALCLRCLDQLSLAEIARVLGRSENAVKGLLHRARSSVLDRLAREDAPPQPRPIRQEPHDEGPLRSSPLPAVPPTRTASYPPG